MTALRPPGLGPIIGHTTDKTCRLWIQAGDLDDPSGPLGLGGRTVGVIGLLRKTRKSVLKAYYFRLQREYDRTGTFVLGLDVALGRHENDRQDALRLDIPFALDTPYSLEPDTEYCARMATLTLDDPMPDDAALSDVELAMRLPLIANIQSMLLDLRPEECEVVFKTFPPSGVIQPSLAFLLGSCRYPGLLWKVKEADRIFAPMRAYLPHGNGPTDDARFTLMVGDQIYADTLNRFVPLGRADTYEEFQERYKTAFRSPNMRELLRSAPTYMILDDHEIEDNWTQDRVADTGKHAIFNYAIGAYMSYQWSHGPRSYGRLLYYRFDCAGYPFFVLDARTQRFKDCEKGLAENHLLGKPTIDPVHRSQLRVLLDWLTEQQASGGNVPKFVACASVFAPNGMSERIESDVESGRRLLESNIEHRKKSDSWPAFPKTRRAILDHIVAGGIQNVIFLTGDIHCSNIARLTFPAPTKGNEMVAYDITSSAFYWPFPFADGDPNGYVHDSKLPEQQDGFPIANGEMHYTAWAFTQEDNFCRIEIDQAGRRLSVTYYDRKGDVIEVAEASGERLATNRLSLAPW